ncbi:unnamed protein product [Closterium sp. NIES-65]|nr:unnamed protein product [Closterium sp. NIES-65]
MHVAGRILNPANQEEDIFGSDAECTWVFKALINQHVEFLIGHDGKGRDEGPDYLLALGDGLRAFLDMKGSFGMPEALARREKVKAGKYSMVKWSAGHKKSTSPKAGKDTRSSGSNNTNKPKQTAAATTKKKITHPKRTVADDEQAAFKTVGRSFAKTSGRNASAHTGKATA